MATNQGYTPRSYLKTLSIIHAALLIGQILFGFVAFYIAQQGTSVQTNDDMFTYLVPLFALFGFAMSNMIFKQRLRVIHPDVGSLRSRLSLYQSAVIIRYALLEGPSLFAIVAFLVTGNILYLVVSGLIIFYFITLMPSRQKMANDLNFGPEEKTVFNKVDEIIA